MYIIKTDGFIFTRNRSLNHFLLTVFVLILTHLSGGLTVCAQEMTHHADSDKDGLSDVYEKSVGTEPYLSDTDGDGINDFIEIGANLAKPLNHDGDKLIDARDFDDDNDGLPTILETQDDSDKDGSKNYLDTDSDNDGATDGVEAGMLGRDTDFDKVDDAFDADNLKGAGNAADRNGDGIADHISLPDHDHDGTPDFLDKSYQFVSTQWMALKAKKAEAQKLQSRKDTGVPRKKHQIENQQAALKAKATVNKIPNDVTIKQSASPTHKKVKKAVSVKMTKKKYLKRKTTHRYTDTDNDGLQDYQEIVLGTNLAKRDSDNDKVSDAIEIGIDIRSPQDSDKDGIIDALDPDDDNDGVLTKNEDLNRDGSPINDDTDNDGVPNYLDANDDGDERLTLQEGETADNDKDGIPDYLDKNDGVKNDATRMVREKDIRETPEVVVLYDGSDDSDDEYHAGNVKGTHEIPALTGNRIPKPRAIHQKRLVKGRAEKALVQVLENNHAPRPRQYKKLDYLKLNPSSDGMLAKKKQVSLSKKEQGFIAWLTSLLPE